MSTRGIGVVLGQVIRPYCVCRHPQLNGDFRSITSSQTTTEAEDNSFVEGEEPKGGESKPMDPALLQVLSYAANLTFQEEEDALGKVRMYNCVCVHLEKG